jgi:hypothetical protein
MQALARRQHGPFIIGRAALQPDEAPGESPPPPLPQAPGAPAEPWWRHL